MIALLSSILIVSFPHFLLRIERKSSGCKDDNDNSTIAITSALPSAKNKDFNGFVGSEKRNPSSENDLFTVERNSERKNNKRFSVCVIKGTGERKIIKGEAEK